MDKFMRDLFSNSPTFMSDHMDDCNCGESCDCSPDDDCGCGGEHKDGKTMIYGFDVKIGPDGKPVIKEYGNIPSPFNGSPFDGFGSFGSLSGYKPEFGGTMKTKTPEKTEKTNIDFIDNPAEGKGKIIAEMPGVNKDDIKLTYRENKMHIQANGETKEYKESVGLPKIDEKSIKALYKNGILEVTFEYDHDIKATSVKVE